MLSRLASGYDAALRRQPLAVKATTSGVLNCCADFTLQRIQSGQSVQAGGEPKPWDKKRTAIFGSNPTRFEPGSCACLLTTGAYVRSRVWLLLVWPFHAPRYNHMGSGPPRHNCGLPVFQVHRGCMHLLSGQPMYGDRVSSPPHTGDDLPRWLNSRARFHITSTQNMLCIGCKQKLEATSH